MSGYPGFQHPQQYPQPHPQAMTPWAQPSPAPTPVPVLPPSMEGTAFSGILGAGAAALVTEGVMFFMNSRPSTLAANAVLTGSAALLGGSAAAAGYRMAGNRAYAAARQAVTAAGVDPQQAAGALRLGGKFGRWGKFEIDVPTQTITEAAKAWNSIANPDAQEGQNVNTPDVVNDYFNKLAEHTTQMAAQNFMTMMTHQHQAPQSPPQQWAWNTPPGQPANV